MIAAFLSGALFGWFLCRLRWDALIGEWEAASRAMDERGKYP